MVNKSKIRSERFWNIWRKAGSVEGIDAAHERARSQGKAETVTEEPVVDTESKALVNASVSQAAEVLGVTQDTVRRRLKAGTIEGEKVDRQWVVTDSKVLDALENA